MPAVPDLPAIPPGFAAAYLAQQARFPGRGGWQPVHTVYVPADQFSADTVAEWRDAALSLVNAHLAGPDELAEVFGVPPALAARVHDRLLRKLGREPIEDVRIDFEDGYGVRPGPVEDGHVKQAAEAVAALHAAGTLPRRWGPRVKSFADGDPARSIRTLAGLVGGVVERTGELPAGFTVTFPKVLMEDYLTQFADVLCRLESGLGARLRFEMQVEAPQTLSFLRAELPGSLDGRLAAAHFGVFDYTAALGLPPHEQRLDHPACDHARHVMQTAFAGTGVELSDGSLAASPASGRAEDVHALWRRHAELVRHSLRHGFHQGWDMHPSHLVSRFATVYAFHLAGYDSYRERVAAWEERREAGGGVMDEPATVRTLAEALRRADDALP
ncbi:aldolase [Actinomadura sp. ATCC 31491]|uniref:Aldolase n=1 Tax=Actinomadura luzonensis TaxID=2805427 RepID=A0ABT0G4U9_9ACTN|nr:aldolase [Actinomadura luzonensis]MCK2219627.1 aldolase [Actinomadura luzonensis]